MLGYLKKLHSLSIKTHIKCFAYATEITSNWGQSTFISFSKSSAKETDVVIKIIAVMNNDNERNIIFSFLNCFEIYDL